MKTLKQLIQRLFKKYKLSSDVHFDVWICGVDNNEVIDKEKSFDCCHFHNYEKSKPKDYTDIYRFLEFEVEDYQFEIIESPEYWLFVKLDGINKPFR